MKGIIELSKAIKIDGKEVTQLTYDTDKITVELYLKAINRAVTQGNGITGANLKLDAGAHLTLGMYAVVADNPAYDISDIERTLCPRHPPRDGRYDCRVSAWLPHNDRADSAK